MCGNDRYGEGYNIGFETARDVLKDDIEEFLKRKETYWLKYKSRDGSTEFGQRMAAEYRMIMDRMKGM